MISIYFKWDIRMGPYLIIFFDKKLEKLNNLILIYFSKGHKNGPN